MIVWKGTAYKGNAETVYHEIQSLGTEYTPDDIVEKAKDPNTELHKCFEWDDSIAAEKWRRFTARQICCSLQIVVNKGEEEEPTSFRLIEHDMSGKAYKPVVLTVRHEDEYAKLLEQAKRELVSFKKRYAKIIELSEVIDKIDKVINS